MMMCEKILWIYWLFTVKICSGEDNKPHIIVIIADDMGFNDVSFHGSDEIPTPNIDALAYNGVILNSHYTQALCTPSRASFLTGKYPIHLGMQHLVILETEPWGLPLYETLLPQYLKTYGYATHAVGKWHLGFFKKEYTPTFRGFDSHYGYWQGLQDYYDHTVHATFTSEKGYDMRRNMSVDYDAIGKYSTTLFTQEAVKLIREHNISNPLFLYLSHLAPHSGNDDNPLQAPDSEISKFAPIRDPERRIYAAMVSLLDKSVGSVVMALREKRMLENSIILFFSDNGAQPEGVHANHGSNYPFRGTKNSPWEGAMRNVAVIWSPLIKNPQRISNDLFHVSDWLPTFFSAAGLNKAQLPSIDGLDMWKCISEGTKCVRKELLHNIDDIAKYEALRIGDLKYIYGSTNNGQSDKWFGNSGRDMVYSYDTKSVLKSEVASAIAGYLTYKQIKYKTQSHTDMEERFSINIINETTISRLRQEATIKCPDIKQDFNKCDLLKAPCLFNITRDPCERINLANENLRELINFEKVITVYRKTAMLPRNCPHDPNSDPAKWNNTWINWKDFENERIPELQKMNQLSTLAIVLLIITVTIIIIIIIAILTNFNFKILNMCNVKGNNTCVYTNSFTEPCENLERKNRLFEDQDLEASRFLKTESSR